MNARPLPEDFERTFREHHDLVYRAAYRITGNAEDAEDALQTLFLRLLRRERGLDGQTNSSQQIRGWPPFRYNRRFPGAAISASIWRC